MSDNLNDVFSYVLGHVLGHDLGPCRHRHRQQTWQRRALVASCCAFALAGCTGEPVPDHSPTRSAGALSGDRAASQTLATPTPMPDPALMPEPGADLLGPITVVPAAGRERVQVHKPESQPESRPDAPAALDLGQDRVAQPVDVPRPPRGGAVQFTFADHHKGWVARVPDSRQLPAAAYGDGRVYVSGGFESVTFYALHATTGRFEWATTNLEDNGPTAAVYQDERVIFNTESCTLFVLDANTGKRLWFKYLGDPTLAQTAVAGGLIFAAHPSADGPRLSAFKVENGARAWSRRVSGELLAAPVVHGDSVYAATIHGVVYRFERADGKRLWSQRMRATTAPWIDGDEMFISRKNGRQEQQIVVSTATGEIVREHQSVAGHHLGDVPRDLEDWKKVWAFEGSRPVVDRGVAYVAMAGEIHATDARTGQARWLRRHAQDEDKRAGKRAGKRTVSSIALAGPQVVTATRDGQLFGLDVDTGYTLWAYDVGHTIVAEPIVANGWVYVTTTHGYVIGLEVGDSTLDGWHMFGGNPGHNGPVTRPVDV